MTPHKRTGDKGEKLATTYLQEQGYTILHNNWRYKHLEVDIIASKQNTLHFVEVKTRTNTLFGNPEEAISTTKMNHLKKAAEAYIEQYPEWLLLQFDVIAIKLLKERVEEIFFIEDVFF